MRYFNKSFFKFALGFLFIIALSLSLIVAASASAEENDSSVYQIVFITNSQNIQPGDISEAITIQTQDKDGSPVQTKEPLDLLFESSSNTGEFLSSSGKPSGKTMNKNTGNRTFYYRDSTLGSFDITVSVKGRISALEFSVTQVINVSNDTLAKTIEPPPEKEKEKTEVKKEPSKTVPQPASNPTTTSLVVATLASPKVEEKSEVVEKPKSKETIKAQPKKVGQVAAVVLGEMEATSSEILYEAKVEISWWGKLLNFLKNIFS